MQRMLTVLALSLVSGVSSPMVADAQAPAGAGEVLTNQMVIDMVNAKLPRNIIVTRIQTSRNAFDVTAAGLVFLRQREIAAPIMSAMLLATPVRPAGQLLTNDEVIAMVEARVARDLVIAKIRNTLPGFDVTTSGLVVLQQRKVPQAIIKAMIEEASAPPRASPAQPSHYY